MKYKKIWIGLSLMLLAVQASGNEITIKDVWVRPLHNVQGSLMAGLEVESEKHARITSIISPAYSSVVIFGPGQDGTKKMKELEFITLPAQTPVVLTENGAHLVLSGNHFKISGDNIPLIISVQFADGSIKNLTAMAQLEGSKATAAPSKASEAEAQDGGALAQAGTVAASATPESPLEKNRSEGKVATAKSGSVETSSTVKHSAVAKKSLAEKKIVKKAPAPKPVKTHVVSAVLASAPVPVTPAPAPALVPVTASTATTPSVALNVVADAKAAEKAKQEEAEARAECVDLARALRECEKTNDMMQELCANNARTDSSCNLPLEQVRKL